MEICDITTGTKQAQIIKALAQSAEFIEMVPKKGLHRNQIGLQSRKLRQ